ncbi:TPA: ead/Ea22-like family protein [Klebsiella pneumoniae]|nr:ead/Ea22-like family protein [Klebsiella pneumoniae]HDZ1953641.1 ead/Ea22-like family protein [Klebsiella pneumoniae]
MTNITELAPAMKAAAEKATPGEWRRASTQFNGITATPFMLGRKEVMIACASEKCDAEFIALANPANVLALVEALEKAQQHIARQEQILLNQDESLSIRRGELEAAHQRIAQLESRTVTPVTYSENADADYCRKWAWEQVKGEVSTEDWTTGDSITYFGFFCWGWDMRRQYNEQRAVTVKLPKTMYTEFEDDDFCHEVAVLERNLVLDCLSVAGIKVEAE